MMSSLSDNLAVNIEYWNELAELHFNTSFYDVDSVKNGKDTLLRLDTEVLGDVTGLALLHLHCHFGLDTISWARRGAISSGVDISPRAIELARQLVGETEVSANFFCGDVSGLSKLLISKFDIVWAVEGIVSWIPDLKLWMQEAANSLKPDGVLYLRDFHPVAEVFANDELLPQISHSYFSSKRCVKASDELGTYADRQAILRQDVHFEWQHSLSDIISALLQAGFVILEFKEYPYCTYQSHKFLIKEEDDCWVFPSSGGNFPLMFSVLARRSDTSPNDLEKKNE